jgi:hypothetical protein
MGGNLSCLVSSSCAGLTRASIFFARKFLRRLMDCRVKPGNDDLDLAPTGLIRGSSPGTRMTVESSGSIRADSPAC